MKILVVAHAFPPEGVGGTERYAELAARGLAERGHEVKVFSGSLEWREQFEVETRDQAGLEVERVHRSDLYFDHWDKWFNPHVSKCFEATLARFEPDVVHLHHWVRLSLDLVRRAAKHGVPSVVHLHDLAVTCPRIFRVKEGDESCEESMGEAACLHCVPRWKFQGDAEIRRSLGQFAAETRAELDAARTLIAPSLTHAEFIERHAGLAQGSIEVLAHPTADAPENLAAPARSPAGQLKLLFFSHLHPVKGAHFLLEAVRRLGEDSGISLDLFGAFSTEAYEQRVRGLSAGLEVRFHGPYPPADPGACPTDVVVVTSLARESYSFWLDEAYHRGVPILAAQGGALRERATDRVLAFDSTDPSDLAEKIRELRDSPERRAQMERAAPATQFSRGDHLKRLEESLTQALEHGPRSVAEVADLRQLTYDWDRREDGFKELLRSEGWEEVLAEQSRQLRELTTNSGGSGPGNSPRDGEDDPGKRGEP